MKILLGELELASQNLAGYFFDPPCFPFVYIIYAPIQ